MWNSTASQNLWGFQEYNQHLIWSKLVELCSVPQGSASSYQVGIWPSASINCHMRSEMKNTFITKQGGTCTGCQKGRCSLSSAQRGIASVALGTVLPGAERLSLMLTSSDRERPDSALEFLPALFSGVCYLTRNQVSPVGTTYSSQGQAMSCRSWGLKRLCGSVQRGFWGQIWISGDCRYGGGDWELPVE